jgi:hypothetical protein
MQRRALVILGLMISIVFVSLLPLSMGNCADLRPSVRNEAVRPGAESGPTRISIGIWLADILRIDSASENFSANLFVMMRWRDPRLVHSQPDVMRFNLEDIWHPNMLVANVTGSAIHSLPEVVEVASDGTVTYRQRFVGSFSQSLDLRSFPFDHAVFRIQSVLPNQRPAEIQFVPDEAMVSAGMPNGVGIAEKLTLQDWRVTGITAGSLPYHIAPGVEIAGYVFEFRAERLKQHYIVKVIIPLLLIVMMSWLVFWIHPSLGSSQISVAITSMLTLIAYRFSVGSEVPKLPYLTDLDAFILASSLLVFLALIEVIVTNILWFNERHNLALAMDRYCRLLFPIVFVVLIAVVLLR